MADPLYLLPPANKRCQLPETHFFVEGPKKAHAFSIETCDKCGCQVEAANAITYGETRERLLSLGMVEVQPADRLEESGYCDALEMVVCPGCYVAEEG